MTAKDTWYLRMLGGIGASPPEFTVGAVFHYKSDFRDFMRALDILESLAPEAPAEQPPLLPGGCDALAALIA